MTGIGALRRLAVIEAPTETETALGGRTVSWAAVGGVWVELRRGSGVERAPASPGGARDVAAPERLVETAEALARAHSALRRGRRLNVDGETWRIVSAAEGEPAPGRVRLSLSTE